MTLLGLVQRPDLVLKKRNSKKTSLKFISEESALIQPVETISKAHAAGGLYKNTSHLHLFQSNSYSELPRLNLPFQVKRRMRITCTSSSRNPWPAVSLPHAWGWEKSPEKRRRKTQMAGLATKSKFWRLEGAYSQRLTKTRVPNLTKNYQNIELSAYVVKLHL